jgi:hypothetical protein
MTHRVVTILVVCVVAFQLCYLGYFLKVAVSSDKTRVDSSAQKRPIQQYSFYFFNRGQEPDTVPPVIPPAENTYRPVWGVTNGTEAGDSDMKTFARHPGIHLSLIMATRNDGYGGASSEKRVSITLRAINRFAAKCE